jgi:hypothetical protein
MAMNHKTGSEFRKEVRAFGRQQNALAGRTLNLVDREFLPGNRSACVGPGSQSGVSNLNGREVPAGGEAMVPIRKKQVLAVKRSLHFANAAGIRYRPDLVDASEAVCNLYLRRSRYLQQRSEHAAWIVAPEPETAGIVIRRSQSFTSLGNTLGARLLVWKHSGIRATEKPQNTLAKQLAAVTWEPETLAVYEESRLVILNHGRSTERMRRVFTGNVNGWGRRAKRSKGQENRHAEEISVAEATR